jgi:hypothetical protein
VEDAFRDATGELLISRSAVSDITDRLWEDYQAFIIRDLLSAYGLTCGSEYNLMCRSRQGDHGMGSPPATRVRRSLRR